MDIFETAQTLPMKKKGHFTSAQFGTPKRDGSSKKLNKGVKCYGCRRSAIKRGDLGEKARFGSVGCSSFWW
jgi:hypothetical protein